jgi:hypothetical protein
LSGRPPQFHQRRERTIIPRSRRNPISSHGRSKRWLEARGFTVALGPRL